jgi:mannose-6-phosphate isomerase-like protein (cupin superfamily)
MNSINFAHKLEQVREYFQPRIIAEANGQHVKLVRARGEFVWHHHEHEDEVFVVLRGWFRMEFRERHVVVREGEMIVVPRGIEHRPVAEEEVSLMLFEPISTVNTGSAGGERTHAPQWL